MEGAGEGVPEAAKAALQEAALAVWTTTAWTLPANLAVAVNDRLQYTVVQAQVCHTTVATPCILLRSRYPQTEVRWRRRDGPGGGKEARVNALLGSCAGMLARVSGKSGSVRVRRPGLVSV